MQNGVLGSTTYRGFAFPLTVFTKLEVYKLNDIVLQWHGASDGAPESLR
jgi:hypothetical protein